MVCFFQCEKVDVWESTVEPVGQFPGSLAEHSARDRHVQLCQLREHLLDVADFVTLGPRALGVLEAPRQPSGNEYEPGLVERLARRRDLCHDVPAVTPGLEHLLHAANLTLDTAKPFDEILDGRFR